MRVEADWYERRHELLEGQVFETLSGETVKLDRTVPGDGTKWYVATLDEYGWAYMDATIEPGELAAMIDDKTVWSKIDGGLE